MDWSKKESYKLPQEEYDALIRDIAKNDIPELICDNGACSPQPEINQEVHILIRSFPHIPSFPYIPPLPRHHINPLILALNCFLVSTIIALGINILMK